MYGIKRNIKKKKQNKTELEPKTKINNKNENRLRSTGYSKYKFPFYDEIPAGNYFSEIKYARFMTTSTGKTALEVGYKFMDAIMCYKKVNGKLPKDTKIDSYYIKQVYPENSLFYEAFVDSMADALDADNFEIDDVIGITEYISLAYDKSDIGGFKQRMPFDIEDFIEGEQDDASNLDW